jgi:hypothetical protein
MPDAEVLSRGSLVRSAQVGENEARPGARPPRRAELPPRLVATMLATTLTTFVTLSGSYTLLF